MTTHTDNILTVISMRHGWITRREIAVVLDTPAYYLGEIYRAVLDTLEWDGLIEKRWHKPDHPHARWEYRAIESVELESSN